MNPNLQQAVLATFGRFQPSQRDALRGWLTEQFEAYEYAKLEQGGHTTSQTPLRRVFVDLPINFVDDEHFLEERRIYFLQQLLAAAPQPILMSKNPSHLRPMDEIDRIKTIRRLQNLVSQTPFAWTLLIGGPGQGKSTLGQLASQIHRAHLLYPFRQTLTTRQRELVASFFPASTKKNDQFTPATVLLPIQIALPEYTTWLNEQDLPESGNKSFPRILQFIADQPSAIANGLSADMLADAVRHLPFLLIFDGFDEVGAQNDRARIVSSISELLWMLQERGGKSQVLATTRPQGYAGELSQIGLPLNHLQLVALTKTEALEYGEKLIVAKVAGRDQQKVNIARLRDAAKEPSTERLMTTPLQVTILVALVQQIGRAPSERWTLFQRYFLYTYNREVERGTWASPLLSQHRNHIERIHARVALLLQVGAESDGGGSARMPRTRLELIIRSVLEEDGISPERTSVLVKEIANAAELRLVFIVEPEPGNYGFEIRSLQEFMAAWALTTGRDSEVEARLIQIAGASMFRNVTLFSASRLFSENSHLKDAYVERVCKSLELSPGDISSLSQQAAILALETLEEGSVSTQPRRSRMLMEQAVRLLEIPPSAALLRLISVSDSETAGVLESALSKILSSSTRYRCSAWACLILAIGRGEIWARHLGDNLWDPMEVRSPQVFTAIRRWGNLNQWLAEKFEYHAGIFNPSAFRAFPTHAGLEGSSWAAWLARSAALRVRHDYPLESPEIDFVRPASSRTIRKPEHAPPREWQSWIAIEDFLAQPSKSTLANALHAIAKRPPSTWIAATANTAWILSAIVAHARDEQELVKFAAAAEKGDFGDLDLWTETQVIWSERGTAIVGALTNDGPTLPTKAMLERRQLPLMAIPPWSISNLQVVEDEPVELLARGAAAWLTTNNERIKLSLAALCIALLNQVPAGIAESYANFYVDWFSRTADSSRLFPKPKYMRRATWYTLLEKAVNDGFSILDLDAVVRELRKVSEKKRMLLLPFLAMALRYALAHPYKNDILAEDAEEIIKNMLPVGRPKTRSELVIQTYLGRLDREDEAAIFDLKDEWLGDHFWELFVEAVVGGRLPAQQIDRVLAQLYLQLGPEHSIATAIVANMTSRLQAKTSEFADTKVWDRLGLPLPRPTSINPVYSSTLENETISLTRIDLKNVGGIDSLSIPLHPADAAIGQWTVILGPNGTGKTTILKSIVFALRDVNGQGIWPRDSFSPGLIRIVKNGEDIVRESTITVETRTDEYSVTIRQAHSNSSAISLVQPSSPISRGNIPLFAYGCRRGSALGGASREVNIKSINGPEIATLFDEAADLIHAETWLVSLEGDVEKNDRSAVIYDAITKALAGLLGVKRVFVASQCLMAEDINGANIPFKYLSDGYLTHAGWFLDLVARWLDRQPLDFVLEQDFLAKMTGLVLLDEIDLHLHPRWQLNIITKTRELMPRMSFVATTHNPLTLVGAAASEVIVLERVDGKVSAKRGKDSPRLLTGGQLYREYFGIEDFLPAAIGQKLNRFEFLSGYSLRSDKEEQEVQDLLSELKAAGIAPDWDIIPRVKS